LCGFALRGRVAVILGLFVSGDSHDFDGVADDIGGALLAFSTYGYELDPSRIGSRNKAPLL